MKTKMTSKERLPLIGMTVSAFIFNTSEFMPIGLLTDIAKNAGVTATLSVRRTASSSEIILLVFIEQTSCLHFKGCGRAA